MMAVTHFLELQSKLPRPDFFARPKQYGKSATKAGEDCFCANTSMNQPGFLVLDNSASQYLRQVRTAYVVQIIQ